MSDKEFFQLQQEYRKIGHKIENAIEEYNARLFPFGKYKGKSISHVIKHDISYIYYLYENGYENSPNWENFELNPKRMNILTLEKKKNEEEKERQERIEENMERIKREREEEIRQREIHEQRNFWF